LSISQLLVCPAQLLLQLVYHAQLVLQPDALSQSALVFLVPVFFVVLRFFFVLKYFPALYGLAFLVLVVL
jgi:hypothetical protein